MTTVDPIEPSSYVPTAGLVPHDPEQMVEQDLPCRKCEYNLRGLMFGGRCPECNTPVEFSTRSDLMRFADSRWIGRLSWGAWIIAGVMVASTIWSFVRFLIIPQSWRTSSVASLHFWIMYCISLPIPIAGYIGWWWITQPDPSGLGEAEYGTSRRLVRISLAFAVFRQLIDLSYFLPGAATLLLFAGMPFSVIQISANVPKYGYLAKLAERIPNDNLFVWAKRFRLIVPIVSGLTFLINTGLNLFIRYRSPGALGPFISTYSMFFWLPAVVSLIMEIMLLFFMIFYGRKIMAQKSAARQSW